MSEMDGDLQEMKTDQSSVENEATSETPQEEAAKELDINDYIDTEKDYTQSDKSEDRKSVV